MHLLTLPNNSISAAWILKAVLLFCAHVSLPYKKLVQNLNCISFQLAKLDSRGQAVSRTTTALTEVFIVFFKSFQESARTVPEIMT